MWGKQDGESRSGHGVLWSWNYRPLWTTRHGYRGLFEVFCRKSLLSYLLSHLFSPMIIIYEGHQQTRKNMQMYPLPTPFPFPYKNTVNCRESSGDFLHLALVWLVLAPVSEWLMREYCGAPYSQMELCLLTQRQQFRMLIILQEFAAGGPMKANTSKQREPSEYRVARG